METKTTIQILDTIKSLQLRADPTRGNTEHEVLAATAKIASLMYQHDISPEQVRAHTKNDKNTIVFVKVEYDLLTNSQWQRSLLRQICDNFFCKCIVHITGQHDNHGVAIVGPKDNVDVVIYFYEYLRGELKRLAVEEFEKVQPAKGSAKPLSPEKLAKLMRQQGFDIDINDLLKTRSNSGAHVYAEKVAHGKSWKNTFYAGAIKAIGTRLAEQRKQDVKETAEALQEDAPEEETEEESRALISLREDEIRKGTEENFKIFFPKTKKMSPSKSKFIGSGWKAGYEAGEKVSLRQGLRGQKAPEMIEAGA